VCVGRGGRRGGSCVGGTVAFDQLVGDQQRDCSSTGGGGQTAARGSTTASCQFDRGIDRSIDRYRQTDGQSCCSRWCWCLAAYGDLLLTDDERPPRATAACCCNRAAPPCRAVQYCSRECVFGPRRTNPAVAISMFQHLDPSNSLACITTPKNQARRRWIAWFRPCLGSDSFSAAWFRSPWLPPPQVCVCWASQPLVFVAAWLLYDKIVGLYS
jgi:hypothetical protein